MTVNELIKRLSDFQPDAVVQIDNCNIHSFEVDTLLHGTGEDAQDNQIPLCIFKVTRV